MLRLEFKLCDGLYALVRMPPGSEPPAWVEGEFTAVLRSRYGLTACCRADAVPPGVEVENGFRCFEVAGSFELSSVGVVAAASGPLAAKGISLFLFSTWETDFFLVRADQLDAAADALRAAGHGVRDSVSAVASGAVA